MQRNFRHGVRDVEAVARALDGPGAHTLARPLLLHILQSLIEQTTGSARGQGERERRDGIVGTAGYTNCGNAAPASAKEGGEGRGRHPRPLEGLV